MKKRAKQPRYHPDHPNPWDPEHFKDVDGAKPCRCGRWTGLRDSRGRARCSRCQVEVAMGRKATA